jgi:hypothetical protein
MRWLSLSGHRVDGGVRLDGAQGLQHGRTRCAPALAGVWPSNRSTSTGVVLDCADQAKNRRASPHANRRWCRQRPARQTAPCPRVASTRACGSPSAHFTFSSGVEKLVGKRVEHRVGIRRLRETISSRRAARVGAVVKAVPAFLEEDVTAHLAAQRSVNLLHPGLDQRVAGFVHHRHATPPARWLEPDAASTSRRK